MGSFDKPASKYAIVVTVQHLPVKSNQIFKKGRSEALLYKKSIALHGCSEAPWLGLSPWTRLALRLKNVLYLRELIEYEPFFDFGS